MTVNLIEVPDFVRSVIILDPTDVWNQVTGMGLGQLAVRLGYPGGFDNRGDVLFTDSFEEGLVKGAPFIGDGDGSVKCSAASSRLGGLSLKLTTDSANGLFASYQYYLPYPSLKKVGMQIAFTIEANTKYVTAVLNFHDDVERHYGYIRYDRTNEKIECMTDGGAMQDLITGVTFYEDPKCYHYLKMVIDLETEKYHRVLVDGWSWLAGDLELFTDTPGLSESFVGSITHYGKVGTNAVSYVDSVIFTQNEPPN